MISKQQIKYITSLQQKKYRNEYKSFVIEGHKMVNEAIQQHPESIEFICYTSKYSNFIGSLNEFKNNQLLEAGAADFSKISTLTNPQEILAVLKQPEYIGFSKELQTDITLVLDSVRDPGNLGTIIRLCDWFGIRQIVCSEDTVDCYNPKVVQATMGAILRVGIYYTELRSWLEEIKLQKQEIQVYGTTLNGKNLYETKLKKPALLILGNESSGISESIQKLVNLNLCIPNHSEYPDKTESLNVSIAAAVFCAEFKRQMTK